MVQLRWMMFVSLALLGFSSPICALDGRDVATAWQSRHDQLSSLRMSWKEKRKYFKGGLVNRPDLFARKVIVAPKEQTSINVSAKISIDGEKVRYEVHDQEWNVAEAAFKPRHYISVWDGEECMLYFPKSSASQPDAVRRNQKGFADANTLNLQPALWSIRTVDRRLNGVSVDSLRIKPGMGKVGEVNALRVESTARDRRLHGLEYWVDPNNNFRIVRVVRVLQERPLFDCKYSYEGSDEEFQVPSSWEFEVFNKDGTRKQHSVVELTGFEPNPTIPIDEFRVTLPPDVLLTDGKLDIRTFLDKHSQ